MKIVVLVKEVPDTWGERYLNLETGLADRHASARVIDEIVERGLEFAISWAAKNPGTEVIALSMAPVEATTNIRKALAMGADRGVLVADEVLVGADITLTAQVLAAALTHTGYDLVVAGDQTTDGAGGAIPAALAELLDLPLLSRLASIDVTGSEVRATQLSERVTLSLSASLPAIVSVTERFPDPRLPNFKGIVSAKNKPLDVLSVADLGASLDVLGSARAILTDIEAKPPRVAGRKEVEDADSGKRLADFLRQNQLA